MLALSKGTMIATGVAAVASVSALGVLVWRAMNVTAGLPPEKPAITAPGLPAESASPAKTAASVPVAAQQAAIPQAAPAPSFDIVRVEPSGETVVAGRAAPGSVVTLMTSGKPAGKATADANGQFVIIPGALKPGAHELSLTQQGPKGDTASNQSVAVAVPEKGSREVVAALAEPGKPTRILSDATPAPANPPAVAIRTAEAEQGGGFLASGTGTPGAKLRIYLNDGHVADVTADAKGQWSLRVSRGMTPGKYAVRADQIDPATGRVTGRAEVSFAYAPVVAAAQPAVVAPLLTKPVSDSDAPAAAPGLAPAISPKAAAGASGPLAAAPPASVTIDSVATANVVRGDSLWRISRKMLGQGVRYTQIYDANTSQIRDPRRIYPGQILVVPMGNPAQKPKT